MIWWRCREPSRVLVVEARTQVVAGALGDAVAVHLAEVPGVEVDAGRVQQHAAQTSQGALWRHAEVTRRVALQRRK